MYFYILRTAFNWLLALIQKVEVSGFRHVSTRKTSARRHEKYIKVRKDAGTKVREKLGNVGM